MSKALEAPEGNSVASGLGHRIISMDYCHRIATQCRGRLAELCVQCFRPRSVKPHCGGHRSKFRAAVKHATDLRMHLNRCRLVRKGHASAHCRQQGQQNCNPDCHGTHPSLPGRAPGHFRQLRSHGTVPDRGMRPCDVVPTIGPSPEYPSHQRQVFLAAVSEIDLRAQLTY